jgi:hypothetical protein
VAAGDGEAERVQSGFALEELARELGGVAIQVEIGGELGGGAAPDFQVLHEGGDALDQRVEGGGEGLEDFGLGESEDGGGGENPGGGIGQAREGERPLPAVAAQNSGEGFEQAGEGLGE